MMIKTFKYAFVAGFSLLMGARPATAAIVVYTGTDVGAGPTSARPLSTAAALSFTTAASAIGTVRTIDFESAPVGSFNNLTVAPGVSISGKDNSGANEQILNSPNLPTAPALDGFNTTAGGSKYVEVLAGTLTFTFATPTQFFGAYFTGVQSQFFNDTITFSDGSAQTVNISNPDATAGGVTFAGFTDAGKSISSITITSGTNGGDFIGVDDVSYQGMTSVPEPASLLMLGGGLAAVASVSRLRKRAVAA